MREGLRRGEVPINFHDAYDKMPVAINLTSIKERDKQSGWGALSGTFDKTIVRITIEIDRDKIESWKQIRQRLKIHKSVDKRLGSGADPYNHFFFFGTIPPDQFQVIEIWDTNQYKTVNNQEVAELIERIEKELDNFIFSNENGWRVCELKKGIYDSWLLNRQRAKQ
jgi:hypothetical protein